MYVIDTTATKLKNKRNDFGDFFKHEFIKRMGEGGQYKKDQREKIVTHVSNTILHSKREQASEASCTECSKLPEYSETEGQRTHAKKANWYKEFLNHVREAQREINDLPEIHMTSEMLDRKLTATLQLAEMKQELKKIRGLDMGRSM